MSLTGLSPPADLLEFYRLFLSGFRENLLHLETLEVFSPFENRTVVLRFVNYGFVKDIYVGISKLSSGFAFLITSGIGCFSSLHTLEMSITMQF